MERIRVDMEIGLKPCPFCGLPPKWFHRDLHETTDRKLWWVVCNTYGCGVGFTHGEFMKDQAAEKWNRRVEAKEVYNAYWKAKTFELSESESKVLRQAWKTIDDQLPVGIEFDVKNRGTFLKAYFTISQILGEPKRYQPTTPAQTKGKQ